MGQNSSADWVPFAFHTWCFPFALICHWISIVFLLYGRRITTHSVDPPLTHFLGDFPGLGLARVPDVVVPQAEFHLPFSGEPRNLPNSPRNFSNFAVENLGPYLSGRVTRMSFMGSHPLLY